MVKQVIRLTETDLHRIVKESVQRILKESDSGIYIKPENKGKFTATKKATGKSTEELTHSKNPLTRKRAIFAKNAKKWNHKNKSLNEGEFDKYGTYHSSKEIDAISKAFGDYVKGSDVIARGVKILRGDIIPDKFYSEQMGVNRYSLMPGDIVIEYPDGRQHTLIRK